MTSTDRPGAHEGREDPQPLVGDAETDVLVVGAGLAGLTTAVTAARAGVAVTLLDARGKIGGRARSEEVEGFRVNEGAHALYRAGTARTGLRALGIRPKGRVPAQKGGSWLVEGELVPWRRLAAVGGARSAARTARSLFSARQARGAEGRSMADWMDEHVPDESRRLAEMLVRTTTYCADATSLDAAAVLAQVRAGARGVLYLHGGWQAIVDALTDAVLAAGVQVRTGRVTQVSEGSGEVVATSSGGGVVRSRVAVLANGGPAQAGSVLAGASSTVERWAEQAVPVRAACLDVALAEVPQPRRRSTYALEQPLYLVDHAATADLAPAGGGLFHGLFYEPGLVPGADPIACLEDAMDVVQPGWRGRVVSERRRQQVVVAHDRPRPDVPENRRPSVRVDDLRSVYVAGDWVGGHGFLADASVGSGREAGIRAAAAVRDPAPSSGAEVGRSPAVTG